MTISEIINRLNSRRVDENISEAFNLNEPENARQHAAILASVLSCAEGE